MTVVLKYSRFDKVARRLQPETRRAVKHGAELVESLAKDLVPKRTGALMRAIHVERDPRSGPGLGLAAYKVVAGTRKVYYGHMVEHGTQRGGVPGGRGDRGPTPPHPFLVPALEALREPIIADVRKAVRDAGEAV